LLDAGHEAGRRLEARAQPALQDPKHIAVDIEPGHVGDLEWPEERQPKAEAAAYDFVDGLGRREPLVDTRQRFAKQRHLNAVGHKAWPAADDDRAFADRQQEVARLRDGLRI